MHPYNTLNVPKNCKTWPQLKKKTRLKFDIQQQFRNSTLCPNEMNQTLFNFFDLSYKSQFNAPMFKADGKSSALPSLEEINKSNQEMGRIMGNMHKAKILQKKQNFPKRDSNFPIITMYSLILFYMKYENKAIQPRMTKASFSHSAEAYGQIPKPNIKKWLFIQVNKNMY